MDAMTISLPQASSGAAAMYDDLALAQRCAHDPRASAELYRCYADFVHRLSRRIVVNASDAEDVVQEVFIELLRSIPKYRGEAPLKNWIGKITVRSCLRHLRRTRWDRAKTREAVDQERMSPNDPHNALDSRAALRRLQQLLQKVSSKRRVIFIIHQVEGFSLPEAAAMMGISVTAAKKRVWHARRDLARLAQNDPYLSPLFNGEEN